MTGRDAEKGISLAPPACAALRHYPFPPDGLIAVGNAGGFSGARLWRAGGLCLRAWPEDGPTPQRLQSIHRLMDAARAAGLEFVPAVLRTRDGATFVEQAGRLWDLTAWMPGAADFHDQPTPPRLAAACTALARLHLAWSQIAPSYGPCPAVLRRIDCARAWNALLAADWRPDFSTASNDPVTPLAERAWRSVGGGVAHVLARLAPWVGVTLPLQPCLCDIWHAHVLFEGEAVSGIIDYGSVKTDHIAVDLARLLGSLVPDDPARTCAGLDAYARLRHLSEEERRLVRDLDETGAVLAAVNWLRWLYRDGRRFDDRAAVAARLAAVVARLERL